MHNELDQCSPTCLDQLMLQLHTNPTPQNRSVFPRKRQKK